MLTTHLRKKTVTVQQASTTIGTTDIPKRKVTKTNNKIIVAEYI